MVVRCWLVARMLTSVALVGCAVYIIVVVGGAKCQLQSLAGYVTFILLLFIFSKHPAQVSMRPVLVTTVVNMLNYVCHNMFIHLN